MAERRQSRAKAKRGSRIAFGRPQSGMEFFGALADGLGIGLALTDSIGAIHYSNATFKNILGIRSDSVELGTTLLDRIATAGRRDFEIALAHARLAPVEGNLELLSRNGDVRTFRVSLSSSAQKRRDADVWILAHEVTELLEAGRALDDTKGSVHLLSARLMQAQDAERRRMARDLHDITGQELAVILMSLTRLSIGVATPGFDASAQIAETAALARKVESDIRTLSYVLHPPMLDELGLKSALGWYIDGFSKRSNIAVKMNIPRALPRLSRDKEIAIFRVVQESLTNVLKHAGSAEARIHAEVKDGYLRLCIEDAGHGFCTQLVNSANPEKVTFGVGILGMRERLQQLDGSLEIESTPFGTQVRVCVPLGVVGGDASAQETTSEMAAPVAAPTRDQAASHEPARMRILIADDHELMRRGIQNLLEGQTDLQVCGEATDGLETVLKARQLHPDLVIMDLSMPRLGGFSAAQQIREWRPSTKILIFTNCPYSYVESMIRTLGCDGYVSKARASADLIRAIRAVFCGDRFYDSEIVRATSA
jgi:signal transduction histidine kinase/CheY-like chemotaxis protein